MEKQIIITIGREFGSGGHDIARGLSEELDIQLYDKELIREAAKKFNFDENVLAYYDEKPVNSVLFPLNLDALPYGMDESVEKRAAIAEFSVIREKSEKESFVIVGRCAENILKDKEIVSVFITAYEKDKIARICEKFNLTETDAKALINRSDNVRKHYHDFYCDEPWGNAKNYSLCLNSSIYGIDGCIKLIKECVEMRYR
jgi:cytidylate kinase